MKIKTKPPSIPAKLLQGLTAGLIGACAAFVLFLPGWLDHWEARTWDWRVNLLAQPSPATDTIRVILLDQGSLDWALQENGLSWPWPREVYGPIIEFCKRAGARSLTFDVLFTEPSLYGVMDDRSLAAAMEGFPVTAALFLSRSEGAQTRWPDFAPEPSLAVEGLEQWLAKTGHAPFSRASFPIGEVSASATVLANVHMGPDPDTVYRRASFFGVFDGRAVPSLGLGAYLAAQPDVPLEILPGVLSVGGKKIPIDSNAQAILSFRGPSGTHRSYSAASVIQGELRLQGGDMSGIEMLDDFRDTHVFFGFSAPGLYDLRPTPVSGVYPGVEIFATMLDNLLTGDFMRPVPLPLSVLVTLLITLLAGMATSMVSGIARNIIVYGFFICLPAVLALAAYRAGFWLPLVLQEAGVVVTLFGSGLVYYTTEGRQKMFIKNAFKQYLSPAIIEQIIANPELLKLGGQRRTLSIFFSDLEGFTRISEGLEPEELTGFLNRYLSAMTDIIHDEGGTVDKYEGDAIIAFWNAPLDQPDHAERCVRAALRCQARLREMRPDFRETLGRDLYMRIGINTGPAVVGNMGSHSRFDYSMLGDAVNIAARLEGINKQFGTYTLISRATMEKIEGAIPSREIARVAVVGREEPIVVYEPFQPGEEEAGAERGRRDAFAEGLGFFYAGDVSRAEAVFAGIAPDDPPARAYVEKCRKLSGHVPEDFRGIWVATEK